MFLDFTVFAGLSVDWLINASVGWFGAAFIIPAAGKYPPEKNTRLMQINLINALASYALAYIMRINLPL